MQQHPPDSPRYFRLRKALWRWRQVDQARLWSMVRRRLLNPAYHLGVLLWVAGCSAQVLPTLSAPTPTATMTPAADWETIVNGVERRVYRPEGGLFARLTVLRLDPAQVAMRVHYQPGEARFLSEWQAALPTAAIIVNGNFFDSQDQITGTLFADGVQYGDPYRRRGGIFYVQGGIPGLESNRVRSYAGEQYDQALQAFPMLITDGQQSYFDTRPDRATRRTVIGQDTSGRVLILVTTFGGMTLLDMAEFLAGSDLSLVDALNLDGGGSSMLSVQADTTETLLASFDPVPAVLAIYPR